eukprot:scaffold13993_cov428-Alexandrium_tamarense.AAC.5
MPTELYVDAADSSAASDDKGAPSVSISSRRRPSADHRNLQANNEETVTAGSSALRDINGGGDCGGYGRGDGAMDSVLSVVCNSSPMATNTPLKRHASNDDSDDAAEDRSFSVNNDDDEAQAAITTSKRKFILRCPNNNNIPPTTTSSTTYGYVLVTDTDTLSNVRQHILTEFDDSQLPGGDGADFAFVLNGVRVSYKQEECHLAFDLLDQGVCVELIDKMMMMMMASTTTATPDGGSLRKRRVMDSSSSGGDGGFDSEFFRYKKLLRNVPLLGGLASVVENALEVESATANGSEEEYSCNNSNNNTDEDDRFGSTLGKPEELLLQLKKSTAQTTNNHHHRTADEQSTYEQKRFSKPTIDYLKQWFYEHRNNPFPTPDEKDEIIAATGLSERQVKDWMAGARRRQKKNPVDVVANPALEKKQKREDIIEKVSTSTSTTKAAATTDANTKQTRAKRIGLPVETKDYLWKWLRAHRANPYPNASEWEKIMSDNKIDASDKRRSLENWIVRARKKLREEKERVGANEKNRGATASSTTAAAEDEPADNVDAATNTEESAKKQVGFSKETKEYLWKWLKEHSSNPFPHKDERAKIMMECGLSPDNDLRRLESWFTRARKKMGTLPVAASVDSVGGGGGGVSVRASDSISRGKSSIEVDIYLNEWCAKNAQTWHPSVEIRNKISADFGIAKTRVDSWFYRRRIKLGKEMSEKMKLDTKPALRLDSLNSITLFDSVLEGQDNKHAATSS